MPNTAVAQALFRTRSDLLREKYNLESRIARIDTHVASLEAAIGIIVPDMKFGVIDAPGLNPLGLTRRILRALRNAEHPLTVRQIAQACMDGAGISLGDLTSDVAITLARLKAAGKARCVPMAADGVGWEAVRH